MKRILFIPVLLFVIAALYVSTNNGNGKNYEPPGVISSQNSDPDEFLIGAYSIGCATDNKLKELGLNIWQRFLNQEILDNKEFRQKVFFKGWSPNDAMFDNTIITSNDIITYYNSVSKLNDNLIYLTRPKLEMLTFAQRSDYHPFKIRNHQPSGKGKWYYGYNTIECGTEINDEEKNVRKCSVGEKEGYVVKDLRPSWEQVKEGVPNNFFRDGIYSWYVEPSVKIPSNTPKGTKVFRLEIYKKDGKLFRSVDVTRENFDNTGKTYDGGYIDRFFPDGANPLFVETGDSLYGKPENPNQSFADYAVYWYGKCDMYLERVRVENDWAVKLFSGAYDKTWIEPEIENIADKIKPAYKILVDESDHNMYPSISYINDKIKKFRKDNQRLSLTAIFNIMFWIPEQRPMWIDTMSTADVMKYFEMSGMNEVFTDLYPLYASEFSSLAYGIRQMIPGTLPRCGYDVSKGILGDSSKPEDYEINLNANLDYSGHHYADFLKTANMVSRVYNVPHIAAVQIHSWYNGNEKAYSLREPTNEEIEMLCGIALTYGAKGIIYHSFNSSGNMRPGSVFSRGLVGDLDNDLLSQCDDPVRIHNAYGQEKWAKIISLTSKLKTLGKEIIKFDNGKSFGYRYHVPSERAALRSESFIDGIVTFRKGGDKLSCLKEQNIPSGLVFDCPDDTFLQVGIFTSKDGTKYLMLVNRRTSPEKQGAYDGSRLARIKIAEYSGAFSSANLWTIIDVESGSTAGKFDKRIYNSLDLGWLKPGEIKLYKFVPGV